LGVDELDNTFDAGQATLDALQHVLHAFIASLLSLTFEQLHDHLEELDDGDQQGSKG